MMVSFRGWSFDQWAIACGFYELMNGSLPLRATEVYYWWLERYRAEPSATIVGVEPIRNEDAADAYWSKAAAVMRYQCYYPRFSIMAKKRKRPC